MDAPESALFALVASCRDAIVGAYRTRNNFVRFTKGFENGRMMHKGGCIDVASGESRCIESAPLLACDSHTATVWKGVTLARCHPWACVMWRHIVSLVGKYRTRNLFVCFTKVFVCWRMMVSCRESLWVAFTLRWMDAPESALYALVTSCRVAIGRVPHTQ